MCFYKTFVGCGVADNQTPRAGSGKELEQLLKQNHRYVFSLIHKFNQDVKPDEPYSERDDIIVISDEAHRTQAGKLARNMRVALPNAAFIGFTGTPLFKHDEMHDEMDVETAFKNPEHPFRVAIVCAMWLTGFDSLDEEQRRAAEEGLDEDERALFDLLKKEKLGKAEREKVKQASRALLASLRDLLAPLERWTEKEQTQAEVETFILDNLYMHLPSPPFSEEDKQEAANTVYQHVWQQSVSGAFGMAA